MKGTADGTTRDRLIAAAQQLMMRHGFEQTTTRQIAGRAGVSERTFFRHFATKVEAAFPHHKERYNRLRTTLADAYDPDNPFRSIRAALERFGEEYAGLHAQLLREWRFVNASPHLIARDLELDRANEELFYRTLLKGRFTEQEARILAGLLFGGVRAVLHEWLSRDCRQELREVAAPLMTLLDLLAGAYASNLQPIRFPVAE